MLPTLGQRLKQIREEKGISLEEIAKNTQIRLTTLRALEEDDYSEISSQAQARGFLKIVTNYLKVDLNTLLHAPNIDTIEEEPLSENNEITPQVPEDLAEQSSLTQEDEILPSSEQAEEKIPLTDLDPTIPSINIQQEFFEIGQELVERRKLLGLSLENIEDQIHIRKEYLLALEAGDIEAFPTTIHAKGHLQNYVKFLDLDMEAILLKFAEGLQQRRLQKISPEKNKHPLLKFASPAAVSLKKVFTLDLLFGSLLILGILAFLIWGTSNMIKATREPQTTEDIPDIAEVLITAPIGQETFVSTDNADQTTVMETPSYEEATPIFTPISQTSPIQLVIVANSDAWVRVTSDGKLTYEGRVTLGNAYSYTADSQVEILTGNAAALQIFFNQEDIGPLGLTGQVIHLVFNVDGLIRPTATPSPTLTPQVGVTPLPPGQTQPSP
jgi:cytoskeletal protein RodZ